MARNGKMSRETLKEKIKKALEEKRSKLLEEIDMADFKENGANYKIQIFHELSFIDDLISYMNATKYDPFQDFHEREGNRTNWCIDDDKIEIIEDNIDYFISTMLMSMWDHRLANAEVTMNPKVISFEHISPIDEILHDKKKKECK